MVLLPGSTFLLEKVDKSSTGIARHIDKFVHSAALPDRMEDRLVYKIQTKKTTTHQNTSSPKVHYLPQHGREHCDKSNGGSVGGLVTQPTLSRDKCSERASPCDSQRAVCYR